MNSRQHWQGYAGNAGQVGYAQNGSQPPYANRDPYAHQDPYGYQSPTYQQPYPGDYGYGVPPKKSNSTIWIVLVAIAALVAGGLGLWFFFGSDDDQRGDGRPSRAEVREGLEELLIKQFESSGTNPEDYGFGSSFSLDEYYDCIVDGLYDDASDESLRLIAAGDPTVPVPDEDATLMTTVSNQCATDQLS